MVDGLVSRSRARIRTFGSAHRAGAWYGRSATRIKTGFLTSPPFSGLSPEARARCDGQRIEGGLAALTRAARSRLHQGRWRAAKAFSAVPAYRARAGPGLGTARTTCANDGELPTQSGPFCLL